MRDTSHLSGSVTLEGVTKEEKKIQSELLLNVVLQFFLFKCLK